MENNWIVEISSVYDRSQKDCVALLKNSDVKKWLHKMVDEGEIEIIQFYNPETDSYAPGKE